MGIADKIFRKAQKYGQSFTVIRETANVANGTASRVTCEVKGFWSERESETLAANVRRGRSKLIITQKELVAANWPLPIVPGDKVATATKTMVVEDVWAREVEGEVLVFELEVVG